MSDKERDGGGLAVFVLAGFIVLLLLAAGGGVAWIYTLQANRLRDELILQTELAEYAAQARANQAAAQAAMQRAQSTIETPAPSAPESPKPTQ